MSDYTPTTEVIRKIYSLDSENPWVSSEVEWTNDEFDRWLAGVKAEAWNEGFVYAIEGINNDETVGNCENPYGWPLPYREGEK